MEWDAKSVAARRQVTLADSLNQHREEAILFRRLATLRVDVPLAESLDDLEWKGALSRLRELCNQLGEEELPDRVTRWQP
jgi:DNA polymerase-1